MSAIQRAQQACPIIQTQTKPPYIPQQATTTAAQSQPDETLNNNSCPCLKAGLFADGKVPAGCPFAASSSSKKGPQSAAASTAACPVLTKQASLYVTPNDIQSKRATFAETVDQSSMAEAAAASVTGSVIPQTCPIRFLDQHSPEAIAEYFEEHKHELPRSHEICVQRFQANDESIRALDAKYGNLVSMIQGLGHKHQPMLPHEPKSEPRPEAVEEPDETESKQKIQSWAKVVSEYQGSDVPVDDEEADDEASNKEDEERESRFDRPMREVRVGESPSRPWGMHVPPHLLDRRVSTASTLPARPEDVVQNAATDAPKDVPLRPVAAKRQPSTLLQSVTEEPGPDPVVEFRTRPVGRCPFGHGTTVQPPTARPNADQVTNQPETVNERPVTTNDMNDNTTIHENPPPQGIIISNPRQQPPQAIGGPITLQTPTHSRTTDVGSPPHPPPDYSENQQPAHRPVFSNRGIAIVLSSEVIDAMADVQNMGTMIIGYQAEEALRIANGLRPAST